MKKYNVPALEKAIAILELIATSEQENSVTDIHKELNLPKSTVFTTLSVLEDYGFVKKDEKGCYEIGFKLYQLGMMYISKIDIIKVARPHLQKLMRVLGYTVHLGILDEGEVLFIDKVEPDSFIKFNTFVGMRSAIHINGMGKAISAFLEEKNLDQIIHSKGLGKYTPQTITDPLQFKNSLQEIRKKGYSVEDEEGEIGVRCIGVPIFKKGTDEAIAAVSVTATTTELKEELFEEIGKQVSLTAADISRELGYSL